MKISGHLHWKSSQMWVICVLCKNVTRLLQIVGIFQAKRASVFLSLFKKIAFPVRILSIAIKTFIHWIQIKTHDQTKRKKSLLIMASKTHQDYTFKKKKEKIT